MKNQQNLTKKEKFQQIMILFFALLMGQIMMFAILWFSFGTTESKGEPLFSMVIPFVVAGLVLLSYVVYNKRKEAGKKLSSVDEKMEHYRASKIMQWAIVEGGNLVAILIYFMVEPDVKILVAIAFGLMVFAFYRPSIQGFANDYDLNPQESNF